MDEYSFISENGTIRQIRDLVAKAKDEEQDARINALEQSEGKVDYREGTVQTRSTWLNGKTIWRTIVKGTGQPSNVATIADFGELVNIKMLTKSNSGQNQEVLLSDINRIRMERLSGNTWQIQVTSAAGAFYNIDSYVAIVEYTKAS